MFETLRRLYRSRIRRQLPSSKPPNSNNWQVLGLNREQVEALLSLTGETRFKHYSEALEGLYENNLTAILRGLSVEAYHFQCGVCFALEQIAALPADLTLKLRELDARHTVQPDADPAAVFANTPFYDAYQRLGKRSQRYGGTGVPLPNERERPGVSPGQNGD